MDISLIKTVTLNSGATSEHPPLSFEAGPVNIIVGPNNSGKSLLLRELNDFLRERKPFDRCKILKEISFEEGVFEQAATDLRMHLRYATIEQKAQPDHIFVAKNGEHVQLAEKPLNEWIKAPAVNDPYGFFRAFLKLNTIKLDGPNRIGLVADKELGDLQSEPKNRLAQLFAKDEARNELRGVIYDALKTYFVLDPTRVGHVRIRLSDRAPVSMIEEKGIHAESVAFHRSALHIADASDGIKAFCGILAELYAGDFRILLIDEPEAFLHPSLAFLLGKAVAAKARSSGKQLFISTHSASFLMGCIQSGAKTNVVRLTYSEKVATARLLPSAKLTTLMRNPLLRSAGILNGVFYEGVVVTEADPDRAFYTEVNERILQKIPAKGARNCLFVNAQNKQTIHQIIKPLRELGIPAAGIVDIDIIKEGGVVWSSFLKAGGIPESFIQPLGALRASVKAELDKTGKDMKRDGGISILSGDALRAMRELCDALESHGLFVVRGGELESWLSNLGVTGHGPTWLIPMLERLGEDPAAPDYVSASDNDVWEFMHGIAKWLSSAGRKGLDGLAPNIGPS